MKKSLAVFALLLLSFTLSLSAAPKRLVLIAGPPSHPPLMHEFNAGVQLLAKCLRDTPGIEVTFHLNGWPQDPNALKNADAIFIFCDGGARHPAVQEDRLPQLAALMKRGVGLGCAHYGVEVLADKGGREFLEWIGGYYENSFSCNPIWEPDFKSFPNHPITRGVQPFKIKDEWYFNMRFPEGMNGVTPILVAKPADEVRDGPYVYPKGPYPHIQAAKGRDEAMLWAIERPDGGRGFGFTGGHFHLNWGNDNFRKTILNALLWIAKVEVPKNGVASTVSEAELMANLDDKPVRKPAPQPAAAKPAAR